MVFMFVHIWYSVHCTYLYSSIYITHTAVHYHEVVYTVPVYTQLCDHIIHSEMCSSPVLWYYGNECAQYMLLYTGLPHPI